MALVLVWLRGRRVCTVMLVTALLGVPQVQPTVQSAAGGTNLEIVHKAMMQQQTDFQVQATAEATATATTATTTTAGSH